jgi:hypothetical protein
MTTAPGVVTGVAATTLLLGVGAGCLDDSITGVRELSVELRPSVTTLAVGDTLDVTFVAEGTGLLRVVVDYGDGVADTTRVGSFTEIEDNVYGVPDSKDTVTYPGPLGVEGDRRHVYTSPGSYFVVGSAVGAAGRVTDSVSINVN